jgi:hypothetical protein
MTKVLINDITFDYTKKQNDMELIYFLIVASPLIGIFLFALLVNWIITNIKKIEQNENII